MLAFGRLTIPEGVWPGSRDPFLEFYTPFYTSLVAEDRIVKFCARVGPKSICVLTTNFPPSGSGQGHVTS